MTFWEQIVEFIKKLLEKPEPDPQPDPDPDKKPYPLGSNKILWKPVSESSGKLMILTPSKYPDPVQKKYFKMPEGTKCLEGVSIIYGGNKEKCDARPLGNTHTGDKTTNPNGNRPHWYCNYGGSSYGSNAKVVLHLDGGSEVIFDIPEGSGRWEGTKNPLRKTG